MLAIVFIENRFVYVPQLFGHSDVVVIGVDVLVVVVVGIVVVKWALVVGRVVIVVDDLGVFVVVDTVVFVVVVGALVDVLRLPMQSS